MPQYQQQPFVAQPQQPYVTQQPQQYVAQPQQPYLTQQPQQYVSQPQQPFVTQPYTITPQQSNVIQQQLQQPDPNSSF